MTRTLQVLVVILLELIPPGHVWGHDTPAEPSPPGGALFLLFPVGAESMSLGRVMTASTSAESAFWNPAGLAGLDRSELGIMRGDPLAGVSTALSWSVGRQPLGVLGLSYHLLDGGEQNLVDDQQNVRGTISIRSHVGVVSAATRLLGWPDVGLNMKVVRLDLACREQCDDAGVQSSGWAGDVGFQAQPLTNIPLRFGTMLAHFGPRFQVVNSAQADPLPTRIRISAAFEVLPHFEPPADLALWLRFEVEDRFRKPGEVPSFYVATELVAGSTDAIFLRASHEREEIKEADEISFGLSLRHQRSELALARSFTSSILEGSEPAYVSFGILLDYGSRDEAYSGRVCSL
jgi:hypothetical protein